jgi:hypothetical protein
MQANAYLDQQHGVLKSISFSSDVSVCCCLIYWMHFPATPIGHLQLPAHASSHTSDDCHILLDGLEYGKLAHEDFKRITP